MLELTYSIIRPQLFLETMMIVRSMRLRRVYKMFIVAVSEMWLCRKLCSLMHILLLLLLLLLYWDFFLWSSFIHDGFEELCCEKAVWRWKARSYCTGLLLGLVAGLLMRWWRLFLHCIFFLYNDPFSVFHNLFSIHILRWTMLIHHHHNHMNTLKEQLVSLTWCMCVF